ncbi:glycosyltransferase family 4 protein [Terribacillus sp. AE2B 122]|uniref:glycosyltransferase family 4 protein n=1 Tax=Terribacillus sp. AE2B 122 TaxID=1331902 RepID=UPI00158162FB|nr:glycosyltransferase family 4 protein [Terribacillus sp. AE2B 122]
MKRKRLFVSIDFPPSRGGIQNYIYGIVSNLDSNSTDVLTTYKGDSTEIIEFDNKQGFDIKRVELSTQSNIINKVFSLIKMYFQILTILRKKSIEEIHFGNALPVGLLSLLLRNKKVKIFTYIYGLDLLESKKSKIKLSLLKSVLQKSDRVITISEFTKREIIKININEKKIKIISPGFRIPSTTDDDVDVREKYGIAKTDKIILTVARLHERKGHDIVLKAIKTINNHNLKYLICGTGPYEKTLKSLVESLNLNNKVIFTGEVEDSELVKLYKEADIFVMASRQLDDQGDVEGYGIVFLEANYYGLPVIGGNSGGIPDAILHNKTGILVDPNSVEDVSEKLNFLLKDEIRSNEMGRNGQDWVKKHSMWKNRLVDFSVVSEELYETKN